MSPAKPIVVDPGEVQRKAKDVFENVLARVRDESPPFTAVVAAQHFSEPEDEAIREAVRELVGRKFGWGASSVTIAGAGWFRVTVRNQ
jgi:hypothetical protein